jgi:hypothetical protein
MALSTAYVQSRVAGMRLIVTGAVVTIRHEEREYTCVRTSLNSDEMIGSLGALQGATGAVRLDTSILPEDHPKAGDTVEIKEWTGAEWDVRVIIGARYDQMRATLRIDYGERYG